MDFNFNKLSKNNIDEAIDDVINNNDVEDYIGSIYVGTLQIALFLKTGICGTVIGYEIYAGGVDRGYRYTIEKNNPYDWAGSGVLVNDTNVKLFEGYKNFKKQTIVILTDKIKKSTYCIDGKNLTERANEKPTFDWEDD